ncbi:GTPase HflX [Tenuibacillus multivorans]|uniref:GTPase HflX n=1 Tax=Tenuibacillus multivorans TaxID=237069 RepID=A0A1G9XRY3_9BACI|nr:GTPase HflX [Tenuibacillus multivorans]GEL75795.1 GTPase HflX [Tenuibacillus multivorans]SDM99589.1 GTP-binding protein HflX [Tenuibacillus multivorans]
MGEKAILVGCQTQIEDDRTFHSTMEELRALAETVEADVIEVFTQKREKVHSSYYIGTGKTDEIKHFIEEADIDIVIMNSELTPSQSRNLSNVWETKLIDRTQLILDIFAMRAQTKEGKLQVELAQLEYMLPRLQGIGTELSRLGGGIGTRGPGETKLETDRRHIRNRITDIKQSLQQVVKHRNQYRENRKRRSAFQISIVGYTNAGKSTLFNQLTSESSLEENKLFATLDPLTRKLSLPSGFHALISDTVGFIQKLPTTLIAAFRSTLEEVTEADFILHVVDCSDEDATQHEQTVNDILKELHADHIPSLTVYNKVDLLEKEFFPFSKPSVLLSALNSQDLDLLKQKIEDVLKEHWEKYNVMIPSNDGRLLNRLKHETIVEAEEFAEDQDAFYVMGYIESEMPLYNQLTK